MSTPTTPHDRWLRTHAAAISIFSVGTAISGHISIDAIDNSSGRLFDRPRISRLPCISWDNYTPQPDTEWDVEEWDARKGFIGMVGGKPAWKKAYQVARILAKHGEITLRNGDEETHHVLPWTLLVEPATGANP